MNIKENRLYNFYRKCEEQGYRNMQDSTEALKAKVIATDLGIKYKDIAVTYTEAKEIYATEQERLKNEEFFQQSTGTLLFKLHGDEIVSVYLSENDTFYYIKNDDNFKYKGVPSFNLKSGTTISYTYHPPKATYTGVTVGGVHTGGVDYTDAYLTGKSNTTGKGYIDVVAEDLSFTIKSITLSDQIIDKFRRDKWVKETLKSGNTIYCYDPSKTQDKIAALEAAVRQGGYHEKIGSICNAHDIDRISMRECKEILSFLDKILKSNFPPSDEELYLKAISLGNTETSKELYESIRIFDKINDYKDSKQRIEKIEAKLEPIVQHEKEQAVLEKEAKDIKVKRNLKIIGIISTIIIIIGIVVGTTIVSNNKKVANEALYKTAISYMEEQQYEDAMKSFNRLNGYNDSSIRIDECYNLWIEQGKKLIEQQKYKDAVDFLQSIVIFLNQNSFNTINKDTADQALEEAKQARNKYYASVAISENDIDYLIDNRYALGFKKLSGEEIKEMIVGEWDILEYYIYDRYKYNSDGTVYKYNDSNELNPHGKYTIEDDDIKIKYTYSHTYAVFDIGDGYYLLHEYSSKYRHGFLFHKK